MHLRAGRCNPSGDVQSAAVAFANVRFIVYGAGAVGGVLGAYLHGSGRDVIFVARGAHLDAIRERGLTLQTPSFTRTLPVHAVGAAGDVDWRSDDVLVLSVKSQDTTGVLRGISGYADPAMPVVCVQNGVSNEAEALRLFSNVYGVCVMSPTTHLEPGVVRADSDPVPGLLDIGRFPGGLDDTAQSIAATFRDAGYESVPRADVMDWKYGKLLRNLANAVNAVCGRQDGTADLTAKLVAEGEAVLRAAGIGYIDEFTDAARRADILKVLTTGTRAGSSSWQSLARGTGAIEADYLNGEIVLQGRQHGVETPYNENARQWANRFARERRSPGTLPVESWLETVG
jgi:2-dehydropantoate 2-reductase